MNAKALVELISPEATIGRADIDGRDVLAVWKFRGRRDWIPMEEVIAELVRESKWIQAYLKG